MQVITWSPQLIHAVKKLKKQETYKDGITTTEHRTIESFQLSSSEERALKSVLSQESIEAGVNSYWK